MRIMEQQEKTEQALSAKESKAMKKEEKRKLKETKREQKAGKIGKKRKKAPIIIAAIIYVVTPIDIFPDILPVVGWIDDVTVILYVCDIINDELEQYKQFIIINKRVP